MSMVNRTARQAATLSPLDTEPAQTSAVHLRGREPGLGEDKGRGLVFEPAPHRVMTTALTPVLNDEVRLAVPYASHMSQLCSSFPRGTAGSPATASGWRRLRRRGR
jgi:hypothetical protein